MSSVVVIGAGLAGLAAARRLVDLGARSMIVRVLEANRSARSFYQGLGGQLTTETRSVEESGLWFPECVYQWPDLSAGSLQARPGLERHTSRDHLHPAGTHVEPPARGAEDQVAHPKVD